MQVAAPLDAASLVGPVLLGPTGKPVVKLFLFAPAEHYDLIAQDEAANTTQRFSQLDPFTAQSQHLPAGQHSAGAR